MSLDLPMQMLFAHPEFQKFFQSERKREAISTTWAGLVDYPAADHQFRLAFIQDVGVAGSFWISNGVEWSPMAPITLASNFETVTKSDADALDAIGFETMIFGGLLGNDRTLEVFPVWTYPNNAATKRMIVKLGDQMMFNKSRTTTTLDIPKIEVINRGTSNSQLLPFNGAATYASGHSSTISTATVDTSVDQRLTVEMGWGAAGSGSNLITLSGVRVRLLP
jgi:hypothetical protein